MCACARLRPNAVGALVILASADSFLKAWMLLTLKARIDCIVHYTSVYDAIMCWHRKEKRGRQKSKYAKISAEMTEWQHKTLLQAHVRVRGCAASHGRNLQFLDIMIKNEGKQLSRSCGSPMEKDSCKSFVISFTIFRVEHAGSASVAHTTSRRLGRKCCFRFKQAPLATHQPPSLRTSLSSWNWSHYWTSITRPVRVDGFQV
jgi:hypothetical protein